MRPLLAPTQLPTLPEPPILPTQLPTLLEPPTLSPASSLHYQNLLLPIYPPLLYFALLYLPEAPLLAPASFLLYFALLYQKLAFFTRTSYCLFTPQQAPYFTRTSSFTPLPSARVLPQPVLISPLRPFNAPFTILFRIQYILSYTLYRIHCFVYFVSMYIYIVSYTLYHVYCIIYSDL